MSLVTLLSTSGLSELSDLTQKQFSHLRAMVEPAAKPLFITEDLTSHGSEQKRYDEIDIDTFANLKRQGETTARAQANIGYNKTMRAKRFAKEIQLTWEYRRYAQDYALRAKSDFESLAHFVPQRFDLNLTHVFTFCTSSSYTDMDGETISMTTGDGFSLANSAHTLSASSLTYNNIVTGNPAFSQGALEVAENIYVSEILSNMGQKRVMKPNYIVTGDDTVTCRAVRQVLNSTADVDAAHAGVDNTYKGSYMHVKLPYLATTATGARDATKKRWWFLVAQYGNPSNSWQAYHGVFEQPNVKTPDGTAIDASRDTWTFGCRGSQGIALLGPRGFVASCPTN